ncbi:MAG: DNA repair and recombination protein RadB [Candidatus Thermoplasmatota archaeon]|jgi:DNA repair protein RadB|nr:DNA repair and recombination protein RadB [Candidatus Thermoplasmatota archaeon]
MEKIDSAVQSPKIPINVSCIDNLMGGGLEPGIITEIYGEGGSGKTNFCMQFALSTLKLGKTVIYFDTEGFSVERLAQVSGNNPDLVKNLLLYRIVSLEDQDLTMLRMPKMVEKISDLGLIIVDSFTEYFRLEKPAEGQSRSGNIQRQLSSLNLVCSRFHIPVLITNQIYQDIDSGNLQPFGGFIIDHVMKAIFNIQKVGSGKRRISVVKHRSIKEDSYTEFRITDFGLSCE